MSAPNWLAAVEPRIIRYATREEWVAARSELTLGASDVGVLCGDQSFARPHDIWARKRHGRQQPETESMRRGRRYEDVILAEFGAVPWPQTEVVQHPTIPWLRATPDGYTAAGLVEAKFPHDARQWRTATLESAQEWEEGISPLYCYVQAQVQLACTDAPLVDLVAGLGRWGELVVVRIYPDRAWISGVLEVVSRWRDLYLLGDATPPDAPIEAPELGPQRTANRRPREATPEEDAAISTVLDIRRRRRFLDVEEAAAKSLLLRSTETRFAGPSGKVTLYESGERETVALARVRERAPDLYRALVARDLVSISPSTTIAGVYPAKEQE